MQADAAQPASAACRYHRGSISSPWDLPMNSPQQNPYAPPQAGVAELDDDEIGVITPFSPKGRLGRVRYLAYSMGATFLMALLIAVATGLSAAIGLPMLGGVIGVIAYIAFVVFGIILVIQRSHDFDQSGWLALLAIVPLLNLIFVFVPGTRGRNRFGPQTPPNGKLGVVVVIGFIGIFVIGILAAIAIPAYQDYVTRARAVQVENGGR
jgi:uncharacterized membrane protein YhaH (DUF805 family)